VAVAEQLGPLARPLRGGGLLDARAGLARRPGHRRGGQPPSRGVRAQDGRQVADHFDDVVEQLEETPAIIGHSFGGLLAQILAGRGLSAATVVIDPAPFRGVLPLPISSLRSAAPVIGNPANRGRAVPLTYEQFRFAFANAVSEEEAKELYDTFAVPAAGVPLFQAATANLDPWTEVKVKSKAVDRGPLLVVSGERDHTVPWAIANASYKKQKRNIAVTEITEIKGRGHSLTIDAGWQEVADVALAFVQRFVNP
jgi:pimeloyl-ACP methyl ester carboxylesterase